MKTPIINRENANIQLEKTRFKVGDIVVTNCDMSRRRGVIGRSVIGIIVGNGDNSDSIYEVQFQSHDDTSFVWDFQIEKLHIQE